VRLAFHHGDRVSSPTNKHFITTENTEVTEPRLVGLRDLCVLCGSNLWRDMARFALGAAEFRKLR